MRPFTATEVNRLDSVTLTDEAGIPDLLPLLGAQLQDAGVSGDVADAIEFYVSERIKRAFAVLLPKAGVLDIRRAVEETQ